MLRLQSNKAIRIRPPSLLTQQKWFAEDFDTRKIYAIPEKAVAILLYCINPQEKNTVITKISGYYQISLTSVEKLIENLISKELILTQPRLTNNNFNSDLFNQEYPLWQQYNWEDAAEYHFYTYDYPFLDYSENADGRQIANQRMNEYSAEENDINRCKTYPADFKRIISYPFEKPDENCLKQKFLNILYYSFAKIADAPIRWQGAPLIRRTSPSGGSRHPTEGYCIINKIPGLEPGLYHIQTDPFSLVQLNNNKLAVTNLFPELKNHSYANIAAIIILTSVFERNMYRYREPRTFRTVHLDAGHILGTIELISHYFDLQTKATTQFNERDLEELIGIDDLEEGVMICTAIFNNTVREMHWINRGWAKSLDYYLASKVA